MTFDKRIWRTHGRTNQIMMSFCAPFYPRKIGLSEINCINTSKIGYLMNIINVIITSFNPIEGESGSKIQSGRDRNKGQF